MAIKWKLESRKLSDIKPMAKNPRSLSKHDAEHLKKSIDKFGMIDKLIVNQDGSLIGGHQRLKLLKKMKTKEIDCWTPERLLEQKEVEELNIRLNRNTGEWDFDILANEWDEQELLEWGIEEAELEIEKTSFKEDKMEEDPVHCPECGQKIKSKE